ncbi:MAG: type II toxin-antitoxin system RelE family toxin [Chthoniobacterales bacterium]
MDLVYARASAGWSAMLHHREFLRGREHTRDDRAGVTRLQNQDGYRIRVGNYRVLYTVDAANQIVRITAVGHRKEVYR